MLFDRVARGPVEAAARTGRGLLLTELERSIDLIAASGLPEHLARTLVDQRVADRVAAELPVDDLVDRVVDRLVATGTLDRVVAEIAASPALRRAAEQRSSAAANALRRRCETWDDEVEARARRWLRRTASHGDRRFAGVVTRGVALVADAAVVNALFVAVVGSVALVTSLVQARPGPVAAGVGMSTVWILLVGAYFAGSWTLVGATPGMRLLAIRLVDRHGRTPSPGRALVRALWLVIAVAPVLLGFVPALVDGRRRAIQDLIAGTAVVRDVREP